MAQKEGEKQCMSCFDGREDMGFNGSGAGLWEGTQEVA